jgi:hypothetical protein
LLLFALRFCCGHDYCLVHWLGKDPLLECLHDFYLNKPENCFAVPALHRVPVFLLAAFLNTHADFVFVMVVRISADFLTKFIQTVLQSVKVFLQALAQYDLNESASCPMVDCLLLSEVLNHPLFACNYLCPLLLLRKHLNVHFKHVIVHRHHSFFKQDWPELRVYFHTRID